MVSGRVKSSLRWMPELRKMLSRSGWEVVTLCERSVS